MVEMKFQQWARLLQRSLLWTAPILFPSTAKDRHKHLIFFSSLHTENTSYVNNEQSRKDQAPSLRIPKKYKAYGAMSLLERNKARILNEGFRIPPPNYNYDNLIKILRIPVIIVQLIHSPSVTRYPSAVLRKLIVVPCKVFLA